MSSQNKKNVVVRSVWRDNLEQEFDLIQEIIDRFPYASMDTEFPGDIHHRPSPSPSPSPLLHNQDNHLFAALETYHYMRINVNSTKLIQLGLTLSDDRGNLPDLGTNCCYIWEFNFEFDVDKDQQNEKSIQLLMNQGIDFTKNKEKGIYAKDFANMFINSGLCAFCSTPWGYIPIGKKMTWLTFHGSSDFGHLIKILNQRDLPDDIFEFMEYLKKYFGFSVYDMKYIAKYCRGLYGGLEKIAKSLDVDRVAGKSHQAGSDSLLTMHAFNKLKETYFRGIQMGNFSCKLSGLEQFQTLRNIMHNYIFPLSL